MPDSEGLQTIEPLDALPAASAASATADSAVAEQGFWSAIRESLRGSHRDYTSGPIGRSIILLAIPMVLEMSMESIFVLVDIKWVSVLGEEAMAAVGLTESLMTLVYTLAIGLSIGATATIARRIGEKNPDGAARAAVQAIVLALIVSAAVALVGAPLAPKLLSLMGAAPDVVAKGSGFTRVMLACNVSVVMLFMINAIFRGAGDAAIAMRVLWLANAINILLGPCLIFGRDRFPNSESWGGRRHEYRRAPALYALSKLVRKGGRF